MVLAKPGVRLGLETELILVAGAKAVHSANLFKAVEKVSSLAELRTSVWLFFRAKMLSTRWGIKKSKDDL